MATIDLALLKKQVRADDFTADDDYLAALLEAAEDTILSYASRTANEIEDHGWKNIYTQAVLMLAAHWYNQREAVASTAMQSVPWSVEALVKQLRKLVDD